MFTPHAPADPEFMGHLGKLHRVLHFFQQWFGAPGDQNIQANARQ
jgi:hypothetical protein